MTLPTLENEQENLTIEKTTEGRDTVEPRNATDPDEPAGLTNSVTGRHVAPESLQDSDPKTSAFPDELPNPCPPSGAKVTHLKDSMKRCSDSLPLEGGPTPPKKGHLSTDSLHSEIKTAPSTNPERTKGQNNKRVWNFINEDGYVTYTNKSDKEVLDLIKNNFNKPLRDRKHLADKFLQMLKNQTKSLMENKYNQQAFAILKNNNNNEQRDLITETNEEECMNNEIELIGPFVPKGKKHSEDFLIKQLKERNNFSEVWIYTTNSPCLGRISHSLQFHLPCLYNLINLAINHNIKMYIGFSKYYIFIKNMYEFIQNLEDDGLRNWNPDHKFQVKFTITEFKFNCKAASNIIKNIVSECSDLEMTYRKWHQKGSETSVEFESTLRKEMMESSDEEFNKITKEYKIWWDLSVDENLNRHIVPSIFEHIQGLYPNLEFFQVDLEQCLNLANEE
ncbi:uncharacterized protein LOC113658482 [Tachysurus fulvidraco]|uniref:uncharacterized protein LOC113658482 n=1 Tax=Tachysurus fulvidraco TaxID=1234273 RepID=UPI001FEEEBC7|nr:uncharacterized protein LOC113658482 [Tachysurus fulvidraco]